MITVPIDYKTVWHDSKEIVSPQRSLSGLLQNTTPFTEVKNSLHSSNTSLNGELEFQGASSIAPLTVKKGSKILQKLKLVKLFPLNLHKGKTKILRDPAFLTSNVMPPTLKPTSKPDLQRQDSKKSQLSTEKVQFKSQLMSLSVVSSLCKLHMNANPYHDQYIKFAFKHTAPLNTWYLQTKKIFTLQNESSTSLCLRFTQRRFED